MEMYPRYKSALGYKLKDDEIDTYGVNHKNFTTRDMLLYEQARLNREDKYKQYFKEMGITEKYPQYGTNFWGTSPDNNFGFGHSNIEGNMENVASIPLKTFNQKKSSNNQNCYINFDGKNLGLFKNNQNIDNLDAISGNIDFQSPKLQYVPDKGPIPEGIYYANQDERQLITLENAFIGSILAPLYAAMFNEKRGEWYGGLPSWGLRRVWLHPDKNTNTYGRTGFSIHGGFSKGSAGCIDIPWQTKKLSNYLDDCQDSVPVYVDYSRNK